MKKYLVFILICFFGELKCLSQASPVFVNVKLDGTTVSANSVYTIEMATIRNISISVTFDNRGTDSPAGANGISFSIPDFTSSTDKNYIQKGSSSNSDLTYGEYFGSEARGGDAFANYVMVEASTTGVWDGSDGLLSTSDKKTFEILVNPKKYYITTNFRVLFRCAMATQVNWSDVVYNPTSGIRDCIGYYSYYLDLKIVTPNLPPTVPTSPTPYNGAVNVLKSTSNLDWANSSDPNGDPIQYEVYFGSDASPDAGELLGTVSSSAYSPLPVLSFSQKYYWQIIAKDNRGGTTTGPIWSFNTESNNPPYAPTGPTPALGATDQSTTGLRLSWTGGDPDGDRVTYVVSYGTYSALSLTDLPSTSNTYVTLPTLEFGTRYRWKVVATDEHGVSTSSHGSLEKGWDFTTIINNPPYAPTGPTPALGATDQSTTGLRLSWTGGDPDGDRVTYVVSYGTYSALSLTDLPSTSNTYVTLPTLEFGTRYRWKVVATDEHGVSTSSHGSLEKGWNFTTIINNPPYAPTGPTPALGATDQSTTGLRLSWTGGDPDGDRVTYVVSYGTYSALSLTDLPSTSNTYVTLPTLEFGTRYRWKVVATDEHGVSTSSHGSLEKGWDFTTIINNPPYAPTGPTPALGATDQSTTGLRLSWTGGDPDGDRVTYVVSYGTYSALSLTDLPSTSNTYVTLPTLEFGTRYRWKVVATDEHGVSTSSHGSLEKGWDFTTIINNPPYAPTGPTPALGATDQSTTGLRLSWTGGDPDGDRVTYVVSYGTYSALSLTDLPSTSNTYVTLPTLEFGTRYRWKVVATDEHGVSTSSHGSLEKGWDFTTIDNNPPNVPIALSPLSGETNQIIDNLLLSWTGGDSDGDAVTYVVSYGKYSDLSLTDLPSTTSTSVTLPTLEFGTRYRWKVVATDEHGVSTNSHGILDKGWDFTTVPPSNYVSFDIIDNSISRHFAGNVNLKIYESPTNWYTVLFDQISLPGSPLSWYDAPGGIHPYEIRNQFSSEYWGTGEIYVSNSEVFEIPRSAPYEEGLHLPYKELKTEYTSSDLYYGTAEESAAEIGHSTVYIPVNILNPGSNYKNVRATVYINQNQVYTNPLEYKYATLASNENRTLVFEYTVPSELSPGSILFIDIQIETEYNNQFIVTDRENGWEAFMVKSYLSPSFLKELFFPQHADINVPRSTEIYIAFNKDMDVTSVLNTNNFKVLVDGIQVGGIISYDKITKYAVFKPSRNFDDDIDVNVILNGFTDLNGNQISESYSYTFHIKEVKQRIINVPYYWQGNTFYCWATSLSMYFKFYGIDKEYWEIANDDNQQRVGGAGFIDGTIAKAISSNLWELIQLRPIGLSIISNTLIGIGGEFAMKQIVKMSVSLNNPVFYYCSNGDYTSPGHCIVIVGYIDEGTDEYIVYHDPHKQSYVKATWEEFFTYFQLSILDIIVVSKNIYTDDEGIYTTQFYYDSYPTYTRDERLNLSSDYYNISFQPSILGQDNIIALIPDGSTEEGYYYLGERDNVLPVVNGLRNNAKKSDILSLKPFITNSQYGGALWSCKMKLSIINANTNSIVESIERQTPIYDKGSLEPTNFEDIISNQFGTNNEFRVDLSHEKFTIGLYKLRFEVFKNNNSTADDEFEVFFNLENSQNTDQQAPYCVYNSLTSVWHNQSEYLDIDFFDNVAFNSVWYQIDSNNDDDPANWHLLTSDGVTTLPGTQNNAGTFITANWKITDTDWNNLSLNAQNRGIHYLYFKITDDAGNVYITPNQASAFELRKDIYVPNININSPLEGQEFSTNTIRVTWSCDDVVNGLLLSGVDGSYVALDQATEYIQMSESIRDYTYINLSNGPHTIYIQVKDKAGNSSVVEQVSFIVNYQAPFYVTPLNQNVPFTSGTTSFSITSNVAWTATSDQTWCTVTTSGTGNGAVTATFQENPGTTERTATITVTESGGSNQYVTVTQDRYVDNSTADLALSNLTFSPQIINAGAKPDAVSFILTNNGPADLSSLNTSVIATFIISHNNTLGDSDDIQIGTNTYDFTLGSGSFYNANLSPAGLSYLNIPANAYGEYYVFVQIQHFSPSILVDPNPGNNSSMRAGRIIVTNSSFCVPVTIGSQPSNNTTCSVFGEASFSVAANGTAPFTYQWQYNNGGTWVSVTNGIPAGASYTNGTSSTLGVTGISTAGNYQYRCNISNCTSANATTNPATLTVNASPSAPAVGQVTQPTCAVGTGSVVLNGLPSGTWTLVSEPAAVNVSGTGTSYTVAGLAPGTYVFTVINETGCGSLTPLIITIDPQPQTPVVPNQTATILPGGTFIVTPTGVPSGTTYTWTSPVYTGTAAGGTAQSTPQTSISGTLTGNGTAVYSVTPISGSCTGAPFTLTVTVSSDCVPVTIWSQPSNTSTCSVFGEASFSVAANGTAPFTYQWQYNNGGTWVSVTNGIPAGASYTNGTSSTLGVTGISTAGNYQYRCNISNCTSANATTNPATLTVNASPSAPAVGQVTQPTCAVGTGSVVLNGLPSGTWTLVSEPAAVNVSGTGTSYTVAGLAPGTYVFTVINATGCSSIESSNIVITADPSTPEIPIIGEITQPTCSVSTGSVVLYGLPSTGVWTLTQTPGSSTISGNGTTITIADLMPGVYSFTLTNSAGCTSASSENVIINAANSGVIPKITIKYEDLLICYNLGDSLVSYQWYEGLNPIQDATLQYYQTKKQPGSYTVKTVDVNGCINVSNAITIEAVKSLSVYPNPASIYFTLDMNSFNQGEADIRILNSNGLEVRKLSVKDLNDEILKEIPVADLKEGIYIIQVLINNRDIYYAKIVVAR